MKCPVCLEILGTEDFPLLAHVERSPNCGLSEEARVSKAEVRRLSSLLESAQKDLEFQVADKGMILDQKQIVEKERDAALLQVRAVFDAGVKLEETYIYNSRMYHNINDWDEECHKRAQDARDALHRAAEGRVAENLSCECPHHVKAPHLTGCKCCGQSVGQSTEKRKGLALPPMCTPGCPSDCDIH